MDAAEIVVHKVKRNGVRVVLDFLPERIDTATPERRCKTQ
jgi:hypothetical protein